MSIQLVDEGAKFPPEVGRYHLYVTHASPFAHRTVIILALKGLEHAIGITHLHPTWQYTKPNVDDHRGWVFGSEDEKYLSSTTGYGNFPVSWGEKDQNHGFLSLRELYEYSKDNGGKYSVPVLWDKHLKTIVSNESSEIVRMLNSQFNEYAKNPELNLYPKDNRKQIDEVNEWISSDLNEGVYCCGLASSQKAYDDALDILTESFDRIQFILQRQRFLVGNKFTEADLRLFVTLLRLDDVYNVCFKINTRSVMTTPVLLNYMREIYQMKGVAQTCNMDMIKAHYYTSRVELNKFSIIPRGESLAKSLIEPHYRDKLMLE